MRPRASVSLLFLSLTIVLRCLLSLASTDIDVLANQIIFEEPLISESRKPKLKALIARLVEKLEVNETKDFILYKILRAHILPLTNCAFDKNGDK